MSRCRGRGGGLRCAAGDKRRDGHEHREQGEVSFHHNCFAALRISGRISLPVAPSAVRPLTTRRRRSWSRTASVSQWANPNEVKEAATYHTISSEEEGFAQNSAPLRLNDAPRNLPGRRSKQRETG